MYQRPSKRAARRFERQGRRLIGQEPTLILRGMLAKSEALLGRVQDEARRDNLERVINWTRGELHRRGEVLVGGACVFCQSPLDQGRCRNPICRETLRLP
jgi:hypothetical protein